MIVFEQDIYPAFTVGDAPKIVSALSSLNDLASKSAVEADFVFRSMNWAWPALTSKARANSVEGVQVVESFTSLLTTLLVSCSDSLIPSLAQCKLVIRAITRGMGSINPSVAVSYIRSIEERVLGQKGVRGFFLDKAAVEQLIALSSDSADDAELGAETDKFLEKVFKTRRLFSTDVLVDFLVKFIKARSCSASAGQLLDRVLSYHKSATLYDLLMDKLTFIQLNGEKSTVRKLRLLNFLIHIIGSNSPGSRLPACITKSELTANILNYKQNRMVGIFTLRLFRVILCRFPDNFASRTSASDCVVKDRFVDLNSLIPLLKQNLKPEEILFLMELCGVVSEYNRTFRGSFADCKFDWLKLVDENNVDDIRVSRILIRFVFGLYKDVVPVTHQIGKMWSKFFSICEETSLHCLSDWLPNLGIPQEEAHALVGIAKKNSCGLSIANQLVEILVLRPKNLLNANKSSRLVDHLHVEGIDVGKKIQKKLLSKKRKIDDVEIFSEKEEEEEKISLPKEILKAQRHKTPPLPVPTVSDPYDLVLSQWSTVLYANHLNASSSVSVDLNELLGSNKLYSALLSLSCENECVRTCAFEVLAFSLRALAMSIEAKGVDTYRFAFREAPQVAMILTWLRNGISPPEYDDSTPPSLPLISTVFVVEAIKILFQPKHSLYPLLVKHVLGKPAINAISDVQMWTNLFYCTDAANFSLFRNWMLDIVKIAAQDKSSIELMIRRGVVEAVLQSAVHLNGNPDEFLTCIEIIVQILRNLSLEESLSFVRKFGLCQWICFVSSTKWIKFDI